MRNLGPDLNDFGRLLAEICKRSKKTVYQVALEAGFKSTGRIYYLIRDDGRIRRSTTVFTKDILKLARAAGANEQETSQLVILGNKLYLTSEMRAYVEFLERDNAKLRAKSNKSAPVFTFGADESSK